MRDGYGKRFTIVVVAEGIKLPPEMTHMSRSMPVGNMVGDAIALLVRRANGELLASPGGQMPLQAGDVLVLYGDARTLRHLDAMKQPPSH